MHINWVAEYIIDRASRLFLCFAYILMVLSLIGYRIMIPLKALIRASRHFLY